MIQDIYGIGQLYGNSGLKGGISAAARSGTAAAITEPQDRVTLSQKAQKAKNDNGLGDPNKEKLSSEQKQQVDELKRRDAEVKAHEQAHMAAGGGVVQGGASYEYQRGPDGKMYAVGGEVQIDVSPENTPESTIAKMQQVQRAALAPAQPSGTDRAVAARAAQVEARARAEKTREKDHSTGTAELAQSASTEESTPASSAAKPKENNLPGFYGTQGAEQRKSWKSTGYQINLQA